MRARDIGLRNILAAATFAVCCSWQPCGFAQDNLAPATQSPTKQPPGDTDHPDVIDILGGTSPPAATPPLAVVFPEIKIPQFTSCTIAELRHEIPELRRLKASEDQSHLTVLLDKIGAQVVETAHRTPNLLSDESVSSEQNGITSHQNFSFLSLRHLSKLNTIVVDEYRVDPLSGQKFETTFLEEKADESAKADYSDLRSLNLAPSKSLPGLSGAPESQGFVSQWLSFYPANRPMIEFRYLGEQKVHGRQHLVVAFAQKPSIFPLPLMVEGYGSAYKLYLQGVAWVDAADFRITRLRTGILSSPAGCALRQLAVELDFAEARVATMNSPLWLPSRVVVSRNVAGSTLRETHTYSNYRIFRAKTKLVLNP